MTTDRWRVQGIQVMSVPMDELDLDEQAPNAVGVALRKGGRRVIYVLSAGLIAAVGTQVGEEDAAKTPMKETP